MTVLINLAYILASVLFILGIKMLGNASTARRGNLISSVGMLVAVVATLASTEIVSYSWIIAGLVIGSLIGVFAAKTVQMTGMPELVALFNGFGGLSSLLVGWAEVAKNPEFIAPQGMTSYNPVVTATAVVFAILVGGVTFTGSAIAYLKLSGKMAGAATVFDHQKTINLAVFVVLVLCGILFAMTQSLWALAAVIILSLALGVLGVIPIGGGDMPVVISFLNSFSGIAASAAGFVIVNNVLIVAGCLVGASGIVLTVIMCKAMNRTLANVFFGGFGSGGGKAQEVEGEMKPSTPEDAYYVLEAAQSVVFVPGLSLIHI